MISAFRYELTRLASLRSSRRIPIAGVVAAAACGAAAGLAVSAEAAPETVAMLRLVAAVPVLVAAVLVGAAASGHERHYGMRAVTLAIVPRRAWLALAKTTVTSTLAAVTGVLGSFAAAAAYSAAIAWAYAGDSTLIPGDAAAGPVVEGLAPAAAAAAAAGLFGLAVGWLATWYRTAVALAVGVVALAVPLAAGWLAELPGVATLLDSAETAVRDMPVVSTLLNPPVLTTWPPLQFHVHPSPPTSLPTTALLAAVALVGVVVGAVRWQRGAN
jgi:hypothetical protein